jgi:fumarate reductase subunit D
MRAKPHRDHPLWYAYLLHRLSGLGLALFLPAHLYILSLALNEKDRLDQFLLWTEMPIVKAAEFGLVFLLAVHMFGGLRLMALELLEWRESQKTYAALAAALAFFLAGLFLLRAI